MKLIVTISCVLMLGLTAGAQGVSQRDVKSVPQAATSAPANIPAAAVLTAEELASLRADVARMQTLIEQMEQNLGFVNTSLTPLKHQFQLEIEAWRIMTSQLEKKLRRAEARAKVAK